MDLNIGKFLVIFGIMLIIAVLIFGTISGELGNKVHTNESVANFAYAASASSSLDCAPIQAGSFSVSNCSGAFGAGTCNTLHSQGNYSINLRSGAIDCYNCSFVNATYECGQLTSSTETSFTGIINNMMTAFTLTAIAAIVVGAAFIMRNLQF